MQIVMPHESRPLVSWLIFDVGRNMRICAVIAALLLTACSAMIRTAPAWSETMLWGRSIDVPGDQQHLAFIANFASQPERRVYVRQRPGAAMTLLGPIFVGTWRIEDGWLILSDEKGNAQVELLLQEWRSGYFVACRRDGTEARIAYLRTAKRPNKAPL